MKTRLLLLMFPFALLVGLVVMSTSAQSSVAPRITQTLPPITNTPANLTITWMRFTLDPEKSCLTPGMGLGLQVFFSNTGETDGDAFTLKATVNGQEYLQVIEGLGAGEDSAYWFEAAGTSMDTVTAEIDALNEIAESNEDDNIFSQMLPIPTPYISCTPTPTVDFEASATALILTATDDVPNNILSTNRSFEDNLDGWKIKTPGFGKRICNKLNRPGKPDKIVAYSGNCAFQIKAPGKLVQTIKPPFPFGYNVYVFVKIYPNGELKWREYARVTVRYQDGSKFSVDLGLNVAGLGYVSIIETIEIEGEIAKIKLEIIGSADFTQRAYVDDFFVSIK